MDNYSYPAGADDSDAPWNQRENGELGFDVEVEVALQKSMTLHTSDYFTETEREDGNVNVSHTVCAFHDWEKDYGNECYTIPEMLDELKRYIESELPMSTGNRRTRLCNMLRDCQGWTQGDFSAEEV